MALLDLERAEKLAVVYAEATIELAAFQVSKDDRALSRAASALCAAGKELLADDAFWSALTADFSDHQAAAREVSEVESYVEEFLEAESEVLQKRGFAPELIDEWLSGVELAFTRIRAGDDRPQVSVQIVRAVLQKMTAKVCEEPAGNLRKLARNVWGARKVAGGLGLVGVNAATGVTGLFLPLSYLATGTFISTSVVSGLVLAAS